MCNALKKGVWHDMKRLDLAGEKFGRLTVIEFAYVKNGDTYWKCLCDCGNECIVRGYSLNTSRTKSCGCLITDSHTVHGKTNTRLYRIWSHIKDRCCNPNDKRYKDYGGRGILICDEWKNDFMAFYNWALGSGYTEELTIDRIDNDKGYFSENCRWVDMKIQCRNTRRNVFVEYQGEKICLSEAAEKSGIDVKILEHRYHRGDKADRLFRPIEEIKKRSVMIEYQGEKMWLKEASERSGINRGTLYSRYSTGDRGERLFRPVQKKKKT